MNTDYQPKHLPDANRKSHPILMSGLMSAAILTTDETELKTQTRRLIKPQPSNEVKWDKDWGYSATTPKGHIEGRGIFPHNRYGAKFFKIPYGAKGDLLWVKETYYALGKWQKNGLTKTGRQKWIFCDYTLQMGRTYRFPNYPVSNIQYPATNYQQPAYPSKEKDELIHWYKRPSLFMPKKAARTWLEITNIRVEQLKDISDNDAAREGVLNTFSMADGVTYVNYAAPKVNGKWDCYLTSAKQSYMSLWEYVIGKGSWKRDANKFVWVVEFKKI